MVYLRLIAVCFILRICLVIFTAGDGYAFLSVFLKFGELHRPLPVRCAAGANITFQSLITSV